MTETQRGPNEVQQSLHISNWRFKPDITVGTVLTIMTLFATGVYGYAGLSAKVERISERLVQLDGTDKETDQKLTRMTDNIMARRELINGRLGRIEILLERVEKTLDRQAETDARAKPPR